MKQTLLIADGDTELCELYGEGLTDLGYDVVTSSDGLDCLTKLRQAMPDAIVLDLELLWGGSDGILALLREVSSMHMIPVITTSTAGYAQDLAKRIVPPIVTYLPKPFSLATLSKHIRSAVPQNPRANAENPDRVLGAGQVSFDHEVAPAMAQSTIVLTPHTCEFQSEEKHVSQTTDALLTASVENLQLVERIESALQATGYGSLRDITVSVTDQIIHLVGKVPSYHLKQVAQASALAIAGSRQIQNRLVIQRD